MRAAVIFALLLVACVTDDANEDDTATGTDDTGDGDTDVTAPGDELTFTDANNYTFEGDIEIGAVEIAANPADVTVDWCGLTTDIRGRPIADPAAVGQVLLVEFDLTQDEVEAKVETNDLLQSDTVTQWLKVGPGACSLPASELNIIGNPFVPADNFEEQPDHTWLFSVVNLDGRLDILMSTFIVPTASSSNTLVPITDTSATLTVDADLDSADPLVALAGTTPMLDWSAVTVDVNGAPYDPLKGSRLMVGKVPVATVGAVEAAFLQLDLAAEALYYLDVYSKTEADLSLAVAEDGSPFEGFTTDGIWLVGVECLSCTSPVPLLLAVVEVQ